jgi:flagellar basal-body rod modification protein FlgD
MRVTGQESVAFADALGATGATGATGGTAGSAALARTGQSLGRDEFLRLLTAQLAHQDPLQPVTNEAFIAQLAQFSALEEMQNMRGVMEVSQLLDQSMNNFLAAGLVGREVRAAGNTVSLDGSSPAEFYAGLGQPARVTAVIFGEDGSVVRRLEMGKLPAGQNRVVWDGKNDAGQSLPPGRYTVALSAVDDEGLAAPVSVGTLGTVTALRFRDGRAYVVVDGREIPIDQVEEVRAAA